MGNCSGRISGDKRVTILSAEGEKKVVSAPVTAAELMLDSPGYVVSPVELLRLTRRVTAAKADEVLVPGKAYMLVPVERVGSWVSDMQVAAVETTVFGGRKKSASRRRMSGSKVGPDMEVCEGEKNVAGCRRLRNGRPWTPVLEPISEA